MSKSKFSISFKKHQKETGIRAVGYPFQDVDIKLNKKLVGFISAPTWQTEGSIWRVWLRVKSSKENCNWRNARFNKDFKTEEEAREWVKKNLIKFQFQLVPEDS